jgi:uncharacterized protein (TIGR02611 family)
MTNRFWPQTIRHARRLIVFVLGMTLLLFGVAMLITPGPGWLLIISGLGILAIEFVWAPAAQPAKGRRSRGRPYDFQLF